MGQAQVIDASHLLVFASKINIGVKGGPLKILALRKQENR
jgi:hypothetical protein